MTTETTPKQPAGVIPSGSLERLVGLGTKGHAVRTDYWYQPQTSRELVIYDETKAFWKARMTDSPNAEARWWFRKRDLVCSPKGLFPEKFKPNSDSTTDKRSDLT